MIKHVLEPDITSTVKTNESNLMAVRQTSSGASFFNDRLRKKSHGNVPLYTLPIISIGDWCSWSMTPHTTAELRKRLTQEKISETCITYVCRFSRIEPEFFEEFAVLSSGLFHAPNIRDNDFLETQPVTYTKEAVEYYISVLRHKIMPSEPILPVPQSILDDKEEFNRRFGRSKSFPSLRTISDRLDWYYLCNFQHFPANIYAMYHSQIVETPGMITRNTEEKGEN